jgi:hypothetical protein
MMSYTRDHGKITFECDECGALWESDFTNFDVAIDEVERAGWRVRSLGGDTYEHICRDCVEEG